VQCRLVLTPAFPLRAVHALEQLGSCRWGLHVHEGFVYARRLNLDAGWGCRGVHPASHRTSQGVTLTCVCQTSSSDTCSVLYVGNTSYPSSHHQTDRAAIPARVYAPHGLVGRRHGALCPSACSGWPLSSTGDDAPACRYLANTSAGVVAPVADSRVGGGVPLPLPLVAVTLSASSAAPVLSTGSSLTPLRHATNAARDS